MAGTVCANWAGGALAVTPQWKLPAVMSRTTTEVKNHKWDNAIPSDTLNKPWAEPGIHTKPSRGLRCSWSQVGNVTSLFFPGLILHLELGTSLPYLYRGSLSSHHFTGTTLLSTAKAGCCMGFDWLLTAEFIFITHLARYATESKGFRESSDPLQQSKVHSKQLFHCCKSLPYFLQEKHEQRLYIHFDLNGV